ncbi:MAG TPA: 3-isopropylmalate dehydrogenase [Nocardioidaceae bacterium]|nr:3-isopropylmalate dehydrogenase [Nocardioidaceae bacterium]
MAHRIRLAVIGGDGIGPEVVAEALKVLQALPADLGLAVDPASYDLGADRWLRTGEVLPDQVLADLRGHDAILLGAVGAAPSDATVPRGLLERGLLLRLRFELDHGVNLRPARTYPGLATPLRRPADVDLVLVREGTEGSYAGNGGALRPGTTAEVATEVSLNTAYGVERVVRDAFSRAAKRPRRRLTWVHKTNVLMHSGALWARTVDGVAADFPDVAVDYLHVDAATMALVTDPDRFDVLVTDNLFGDILSDLAAAVTGGIGLAASANLNPAGTSPGMFEPVHGSAPDLAGRHLADPRAAILSAALMLDHLGEPAAAARVQRAVYDDVTMNAGMADRRTEEVGDAIAARVAG